jgi:hypothetical protein
VVWLSVYHFFGSLQRYELILLLPQLLISPISALDSSSSRVLGRTTPRECLSSFPLMRRSHSSCFRFFKPGEGFDPIIGENMGQPKTTKFLNLDNTSAILTLPQGKFTSFISLHVCLSYYIDCRLRRLSRWRVLLCTFSFGDLAYHRCLSLLPNIHDPFGFGAA